MVCHNHPLKTAKKLSNFHCIQLAHGRPTGLCIHLVQGGVTPIDPIVTAATALVNLYTQEGVESLCILLYTSINVHIVNGQRLKFNPVNGQSPENQRGQQSKC